jgi:hypothetical protein
LFAPAFATLQEEAFFAKELWLGVACPMARSPM